MGDHGRALNFLLCAGLGPASGSTENGALNAGYVPVRQWIPLSVVRSIHLSSLFRHTWGSGIKPPRDRAATIGNVAGEVAAIHPAHEDAFPLRDRLHRPGVLCSVRRIVLYPDLCNPAYTTLILS